jgi:hypothetical protein
VTTEPSRDEPRVITADPGVQVEQEPDAPTTIADEVAALRTLVALYLPQFSNVRELATGHLDRIVAKAPVPERIWVHRCGVVLIRDEMPPPCHVCVSTPQIPFQRLYTLPGGVA